MDSSRRLDFEKDACVKFWRFYTFLLTEVDFSKYWKNIYIQQYQRRKERKQQKGEDNYLGKQFNRHSRRTDTPFWIKKVPFKISTLRVESIQYTLL